MKLRLPLALLAFSTLACAAAEESGGADTNRGDRDTHEDGNDSGDDDSGDGDSSRVVMETTLGTIVLELDAEAAPITTENFLSYVDEGFFDGDDDEGATTFHRVISGFMIQGGGYTASGAEKMTHEAIELESENGLSNLRGTIAMARTTQPDTATSQFFINHVDNASLDYQSARNPGYAVFGEVVDGMDVVDAIADVATDGNDEPTTDVVIGDCERE